MDLRKQFPRSPREKLEGVAMLPRTIDKARARAAGTLGEYIFDCPMDRRLFEAMRTDGEEFLGVVTSTDEDPAIVSWFVRNGHMPSGADLDSLNADIDDWKPKTGESRARFEAQREKIAPGRPDIKTWTDLIDVEEGRRPKG
ncbi:MAG TPA: DUF5069 domain-containing protein [Candidatus Eremiobacteraceae bacterium]|nr:DUF5069 domain-containing protein [Candidatus Eremiobacteraceae bacterium]